MTRDPHNTHTKPGLGFILAGGTSRRMGGAAKGLLPLDGRPVLSHGIERLAPQVGELVLNSNLDQPQLKPFGLPVIPDGVGAGEGPLAGLLGCLSYAAARAPEDTWIITAPWDAPFLPRDLVMRLIKTAGDSDAVIAMSAGRRHGLTGAWRISLLPKLREAFDGGMRAATDWADLVVAAVAEFDTAPVDPFFNINTKDDLAEAERLIALLEDD